MKTKKGLLIDFTKCIGCGSCMAACAEQNGLPPPTPEMTDLSYKNYTVVSFDHKTHSESYGLKCIECHHVEKCGHCHGTDTASMMVEEAKIALHETCMGCHRMIESGPRKCDDCHKKPAK
ncbi:MAG: hypothetical protein COV46_02815 [Deltaproteobacteria bacterium CG11_big_fil_rev_8_21_14_0_20_49_13]|nr:MAG: hypothetical protein COV46_02815 [Deltaproteobacteria bacterium CG11_big_fil_rev_8_21_14_0_20_49_13]